MPEKIAARTRSAIEEKVFPGCVIGIVRANGEREVLPFGKLTYEKDAPDVTENTIYDLASITKSIPVASLAAVFVASARFDLDDKVTNYIPELRNDFGATIEDLLRYRVHGPRMSELAKRFPTFEQIRTHVFEVGFDDSPGDPEYTNLPAFLLGIILERISGEILPALAHIDFFGPLKMNDTTFFPHDIERIAPTEIAGDEEIKGIVHDESARIFALKRRAVGHAGLFSTAPDLLNFLQAMLDVGHPTSRMVEVADAAQRGLGWQQEGDLFGSQQGSTLLKSRRFGKTGFTGTSVVVDPEQGVGLVILSNRTYPKRPPDSSAINFFRAGIADIVLY